MGYRAEKERIENKKKVLKRIVLCILFVCILSLCVFSSFVAAKSWKYHVGKPNISKRAEGELRIHFLNVGQGDCTLIELPDGKNVLVDGGNGSEDSTEHILRYLNALDIDVLDCVIVTHADKDHCGGLKTILEYKEIRVAYLPPNYTEENSAYAEFLAELLKTDCERVPFSRELTDLGKTAEETEYPYSFSFLYPYSEDVNALSSGEMEMADDNLYSAVFYLEYQDVGSIFLGDAPSTVEEILVRDDKMGFFEERGISLKDTEILKVAHHGSDTSTSAAFLEYLGAETALISCGENAYGHPSSKTTARLDAAGVKTFRTDLDGYVMLTIGENGKYTITTENEKGR